ncbi:hypothetical protein JW960_13915 [candidate division KSB1 bacterium]|nr:hypothetical protein [candidate division KSB1 bacterium]
MRGHTQLKKWCILVLLILTVPGCNRSNSSKFEDDDIIFQTSLSDLSEAIQIATGSKYSHCGIIYGSEDGYWVLSRQRASA